MGDDITESLPTLPKSPASPTARRHGSTANFDGELTEDSHTYCNQHQDYLSKPSEMFGHAAVIHEE